MQQDIEKRKYILKPYNFEISPLLDPGLGVERDFSYSSSACNFLLKVGFDMSMPFSGGIPYLSRAETRRVRDSFSKRQDKAAIADIDIKSTDTESLAFMARVRSEIDSWKNSRAKDALDYVNIGKPPHVTAEGVVKDAEDEHQANEPLSRFERRLVYQLVRAEYPDLVAIGKRDFLQIVRFNKAREDAFAADRLKVSTSPIYLGKQPRQKP